MATVRTVRVSIVVLVLPGLRVLTTAMVVIVRIVLASIVAKVAVIVITMLAAIVRDLTMTVRRGAIVRVRVPVTMIRMLNIASRNRLSTRNSLLTRMNRFV